MTGLARVVALGCLLVVTCARAPEPVAPRPIALTFDQPWIRGTIAWHPVTTQRPTTITLEVRDGAAATEALGVPPFGGTLAAGRSIQCVEVRLLCRAANGAVRPLSYQVNDAPPLWSAPPVWCPHVGSRFELTFTLGPDDALQQRGEFSNRFHLGDEWSRTHAEQFSVVLARLPDRDADLREIADAIMSRALAKSAWVPSRPEEQRP